MMMCVCVCVYRKKNIKVPWLLRTAGLVVCVHVFSNTWLRTCIGIVVAELLSRVQLFATPWIVAHQAPLFMEFFSQEYWSGLPCPPPGHLPNPGIKPGSSALQADSLPSEPPDKPHVSGEQP